MIKVVCISDTHSYHDKVKLPDGDILVHAGDFSFNGLEREVRPFGEWLRKQPHKYKLLIAGNHDKSFENMPELARSWLFGDVDDKSLIYLQDESAHLQIGDRTVHVYGSPWQPEFGFWAFNLPRGEALKQKWDRIPENLDILITHGPPKDICDKVDDGDNVGCWELREAIIAKKPKIHVVGHIHEGYGVERLADTKVINASICTVRYQPTNKPIVVEI